MERLADLAHTQWAGWMRYLFRFGVDNPDGTFTITADKVARWTRQACTDYGDLPENEKESDRVEARKVFALLEATRAKERKNLGRNSPSPTGGRT